MALTCMYCEAVLGTSEKDLTGVCAAPACQTQKAIDDSLRKPGLHPYQVRDTVGGQTITAEEFSVNLDAEDVGSPLYAISDDEISFALPGIYRIDYAICTQSTSPSANRGDVESWMDSDESGSWTMIPGSKCPGFHPAESGLDTGGNVIGFHLELKKSAKIRLRAQLVQGNPNGETIPGLSKVLVLKVA